MRVRVIGERDGLDPDIRRLLEEAEELTRRQRNLTLVVAFNYGARRGDRARRSRAAADVRRRGKTPRRRDRADRSRSRLDAPDICRPRPHHPHQRRAAAVELPAVAVGLLANSVFVPIYWPDFRPRRARSSHRRIPPAASAASAGSPPGLWVVRVAATTAPSKNLTLQVISSAVMAPIAIVIAWLGGWPFVAFWTIAAAIVLWEWDRLVRARAGSFRCRFHFGWMIAGLVYAAAVLLPPVILRHDAAFGFVAILFLFAVVWITDIAAYFGGRLIGGPETVARGQPEEDLVGRHRRDDGRRRRRVAGGALLGLALAPSDWRSGAGPVDRVAEPAIFSNPRSSASFGAKDASQLIPGHGGLMDRLDGFWTAALAAAMVGLLRGGLDGPARGLLVW